MKKRIALLLCAALLAGLLGFETVSMRDEFETIYGAGVVKTAFLALDPAA